MRSLGVWSNIRGLRHYGPESHNACDLPINRIKTRGNRHEPSREPRTTKSLNFLQTP
jgi:hypothetical protein